MNPLQAKMFSEIHDLKLFKKAQAYGLDYLQNAFERNVYPTQEACQNLTVFEEEFPEKSGNVDEVLDLLHQYGSPATVAQVGGRYYGFVNGSVVPAGLAAKNLSIFWDQNTALQVISLFQPSLNLLFKIG